MHISSLSGEGTEQIAQQAAVATTALTSATTHIKKWTIIMQQQMPDSLHMQQRPLRLCTLTLSQ